MPPPEFHEFLELSESKVAEIFIGFYDGIGVVSVRGIIHSALVQIEGLNLRWDFGGLDKVTQNKSYAFVIKAQGVGNYYEFPKAGKTVSPSQTFLDCKVIQNPKFMQLTDQEREKIVYVFMRIISASVDADGQSDQ